MLRLYKVKIRGFNDTPWLDDQYTYAPSEKSAVSRVVCKVAINAAGRWRFKGIPVSPQNAGLLVKTILAEKIYKIV